MLHELGIAAALGLRWLHWIAVAAALYGVLRTAAAIWQGRAWAGSDAKTRLRPRTQASLRWLAGGAWLALGCAVAWPVVYAASVSGPQPPGVWASMALAAQGWFPSWSELGQWHPAWVSSWRPDAGVPPGSRALARGEQAAAWLGAAYLAGAGVVFARQASWRLAAAMVVVACLLLAPGTPRPELVLAPATPHTFRQPPTDFDAGRILAGARHYQQLCASCHGAKGRGDGPLAARQPRWPSVLGPALFEHRHAGDLHWSVRQGLGNGTEGKAGASHAYGAALSSQEAWNVLDYLRAGAAGAELADHPGWRQALPAPDMALRCARLPQVQRLRDLRGQRVRIHAAHAGTPPVMPDPRLIDVVLRPGDPLRGPPGSDVGWADCGVPDAVSAAAWQAYAWVAGREAAQLDGAQFLVDRGGWLRAYQAPGDTLAWSAPDTMCEPGEIAPDQRTGEGLSNTLQRIDAQPVSPPLFRARS